MKRKSIPKTVRLKVYEKYNGHCAYCGCELEYKAMQVDHIKSVYRAERHGDGVDDTLNNYMPACRACNFYKGTGTIEKFRDNIENSLLRNLKNNFNFKMLVKYGILQVKKKNIRFYFEEVTDADSD